MSDFIDELMLKLACETPLPSGSASGHSTAKSFTARPYTRARARSDQQAKLLLNPSPHDLDTPETSRKRGHKPEFDIFADTDTPSASLLPTSKKLRSNKRIPLAIKVDSANNTPLPSPRQPDRPFPFSRADPLWDNVENYDPRPYYMTPPPTPGGSSPTTSPSSFSTPRRSARAARLRRVPSADRLPPPRNGVLYNVLELDNWNATGEQIKNAYRKIAVEYHPDKVAADQREAATHVMQNVNAAKDVLMNDARRRAYHRNGKLPWTT